MAGELASHRGSSSMQARLPAAVLPLPDRYGLDTKHCRVICKTAFTSAQWFLDCALLPICSPFFPHVWYLTLASRRSDRPPYALLESAHTGKVLWGYDNANRGSLK
ncbi:hypothetical protein Bbelb_168370 [Branchiostoma belcheri]|nr:hypothetical protein Bbelb_168370 [Branchiostoma belcheri]